MQICDPLKDHGEVLKTRRPSAAASNIKAKVFFPAGLTVTGFLGFQALRRVALRAFKFWCLSLMTLQTRVKESGGCEVGGDGSLGISSELKRCCVLEMMLSIWATGSGRRKENLIDVI